MAEIVNLRRARKTKARMKVETQAAENRARHGVTKAQHRAAELEKVRAIQAGDAHKLDEKA